jgi:hypothetical protein
LAEHSEAGLLWAASHRPDDYSEVLVRLHEAVRLSAAVERKVFGDDWLKREATVTALRSRLARVIVARFWSAG